VFEEEKPGFSKKPGFCDQTDALFAFRGAMAVSWIAFSGFADCPDEL
jgi:hypothetical protein